MKSSNQQCQCGRIGVLTRLKRVFGGQNAPQGRFPWQIYLQVKIIDMNDDYDKFYGGALISKKHIVTCAKCMDIFFE